MLTGLTPLPPPPGHPSPHCTKILIEPADETPCERLRQRVSIYIVNFL